MTQQRLSANTKLRSAPLILGLALASSIAWGYVTNTATPLKMADIAAPVQARYQAPGFYRFQLGHMEITALSDGTVPQAMDQLMVAATGQVQQLLRESFETLPVETSMNAFVVHTGQHLLLVDTGAGSSFGPEVGNHLLRNLQAAGYSAEDMDAVLLTHVHGDHSGGLIDAQGRAGLFSPMRSCMWPRLNWHIG